MEQKLKKIFEQIWKQMTIFSTIGDGFVTGEIR